MCARVFVFTRVFPINSVVDNNFRNRQQTSSSSLLLLFLFCSIIFKIEVEALTHDLELDDVAGSVALDVAGDTGVVSGLRPADLPQGQALLLDYHTHLDVVLEHVTLSNKSIIN